MLYIFSNIVASAITEVRFSNPCIIWKCSNIIFVKSEQNCLMVLSTKADSMSECINNQHLYEKIREINCFFLKNINLCTSSYPDFINGFTGKVLFLWKSCEICLLLKYEICLVFFSVFETKQTFCR